MFHYTTEQRWERIRQEKVVRPLCRFIDPSSVGVGGAFLPPRAFQSAVFGLYEERPAWIPDHPETWYPLVMRFSQHSNHSPLVLLEIELAPEDDAYVADMTHITGMDGIFISAGGLPSKVYHWNRMRRYASSLTPLRTYDGSHRAPEIVVFNEIPVERCMSSRETTIDALLFNRCACPPQPF